MAKKSKKRFSPEMAKSGRPIMAAVAIRDVNDKFSSYPSDGLTPVKLARIFKEADAGDPSGRWSCSRRWKARTPICSPSCRPANLR